MKKTFHVWLGDHWDTLNKYSRNILDIRAKTGVPATVVVEKRFYDVEGSADLDAFKKYAKDNEINVVYEDDITDSFLQRDTQPLTKDIRAQLVYFYQKMRDESKYGAASDILRLICLENALCKPDCEQACYFDVDITPFLSADSADVHYDFSGIKAFTCHQLLRAKIVSVNCCKFLVN